MVYEDSDGKTCLSVFNLNSTSQTIETLSDLSLYDLTTVASGDFTSSAEMPDDPSGYVYFYGATDDGSNFYFAKSSTLYAFDGTNLAQHTHVWKRGFSVLC